MLKYLAVIIFIALSLVYFFIPISPIESAQLFLTIATFLFAIFTGFFIARQGIRHGAIRDNVTEFDGQLLSIYRQFGHLELGAQEKAKEIIKNYYELILEHKAWDYHFVRKSSTLISLHHIAEEASKDQQLLSLKHIALERILTSLKTMQATRKNMIALHNERIPKFQWMLIILLALILLLTISTIPSYYNLLGAVLKGAFSASIIFVVILLYEFNMLRFYEKTMGEQSARDTLDVFIGEK